MKWIINLFKNLNLNNFNEMFIENQYNRPLFERFYGWNFPVLHMPRPVVAITLV